MSPIGPFTSAATKPVICPSNISDPGGAIDPDVFTDPATGQAYLTWKTEGNFFGNHPSIWVARLDSTGTKLATTPKKLMTSTRTAGRR